MNTENKSAMYVITHKVIDNRIKQTGYKYLGVGNKQTKADENDSTGENISSKNQNYCELTGLYWIWKNSKMDYVGLCHYRRFFVSQHCGTVEISKLNDLNSILENYDIIVPHKVKLLTSVRKHYEMSIKNDALEKICEVIVKLDPTYSKHVQRVLNTHNCSYYNMFYSKKTIIDKYCEWLFPILFNFEKCVNMDGWDNYEKRLYGFLSEILFNIWLSHENLNIYEMDVFMSEKFPKSIHGRIKYHMIYTRKSLVKIVVWPFIKKKRLRRI